MVRSIFDAGIRPGQRRDQLDLGHHALAGLTGQQIGGYLSDKKGRLTACYVGMGALAAG